MDVVKNRMQGSFPGAGFARNLPTLNGVQQAAESMVEERPVVSTLIVFGVGLGLGAALGVMIADCMAAPPSKFHGPESLAQNIMDGLSRVVPDVITRQFRS
jgi:hypothetical protein